MAITIKLILYKQLNLKAIKLMELMENQAITFSIKCYIGEKGQR